MKQRKLLQELYQACLNHDFEKIRKIKQNEFAKILKHKKDQKPFSPKWTIIGT